MKTYYRVDVKLNKQWITGEPHRTLKKAKLEYDKKERWQNKRPEYQNYRYRIVKVTEEIVR